MSDLKSTNIAEVVAACRAGLNETVQALGRALDAVFRVDVGEPTPHVANDPQIAGPGLLVLLGLGGDAALAAIPESSGLLPSWVASPDPTGASKLTTLAQELGMLLLPETLMVDDFRAVWVADLGAALAAASPYDEAHQVTLTLHTDAPARRLEEFAEAEAGILTSALFLLFGALILPIGVPHWDFATLLYAVLSLTLVRMLPVALSLVGTGLGPGAVGLLAWFGPRGIASVLYLLLAVQALGGAEGGQEALERLTSVVSLTVFISIFLHGLSAAPLAALYLRHKGLQGRRG